jgi:ribosomal protein L11
MKLSEKRIRARIKSLKEGQYDIQIIVNKMSSFDIIYGMASLAKFLSDGLRKEKGLSNQMKLRIRKALSRSSLNYSKILLSFTRKVLDAAKRRT